ncbi:hypothetical protein [Streptomyces sp. NPDC052496]|uniref:hypothetical protein n=1 Tax=Streptomyces sp. NPDC052496 TaxID=3154951 RepID=UPI003448862B
MYYGELAIRTRYDQLRREADQERLARQAREGRQARTARRARRGAGSAGNGAGGRVNGAPDRYTRAA